MISVQNKEKLLWLALMFFLVGGSLLLWEHRDMAFISQTPFITGMMYIGLGVLAVTGAYYIFWGVSVCFYRPAPLLPELELPACTVLVPAYNEGRHVAETLETLLASEYPAEKLQIIAINDGSRDDTWEWIRKSEEKSNGRISSINLERNGGKKHALCIGILAARNPFIVTVDSDSIVMKSTLRHLLSPFRNPKVGAVAGNVIAQNRHVNFITEMLDVVLIFGCDFMRAAQSITGCVVCTPGALSAYRREVLLPHLDEWLKQTFLGAPAHIGEDRAITTLILRDGYQVVHQSTAVAETTVPEHYAGLCKMLIRWTRSDVRENLMMIRFLFDGAMPCKRQSLLLIHWFALMMNVSLPAIFVPLFGYLLITSPRPLDFLILNGFSALVFTLIPAVVYAEKRSVNDAIWTMMYSVFSLLALAWICPYSCLTMRNSKWLTRELPTSHQRSGISNRSRRLFLRGWVNVRGFLLSYHLF